MTVKGAFMAATKWRMGARGGAGSSFLHGGLGIPVVQHSSAHEQQ